MVGHTVRWRGQRRHTKIKDFIDLLYFFQTMPEALKIVTISRKDPDSRRYLPARMSCQMRFALTSTLTIIIPKILWKKPGMTVTVVAAKSSAKACLIAGMLPFVHTFTVGAVSFSAVEFSNIFVT